MDTIGKGAGTGISKAYELLYPYALSLFIEFMPQDRSYIHFIYDVYFALFTRRLRRSSDNDSVYQFVAHFTRKFWRFQILLDTLYKFANTLPYGFCLALLFFKFCYFRCKCFLLLGIFLNKVQADIFRHFAVHPVFVSGLVCVLPVIVS